jgi:hypothetical protein
VFARLLARVFVWMLVVWVRRLVLVRVLVLLE